MKYCQIVGGCMATVATVNTLHQLPNPDNYWLTGRAEPFGNQLPFGCSSIQFRSLLCGLSDWQKQNPTDTPCQLSHTVEYGSLLPKHLSTEAEQLTFIKYFTITICRRAFWGYLGGANFVSKPWWDYCIWMKAWCTLQLFLFKTHLALIIINMQIMLC